MIAVGIWALWVWWRMLGQSSVSMRSRLRGVVFFMKCFMVMGWSIGNQVMFIVGSVFWACCIPVRVKVVRRMGIWGHFFCRALMMGFAVLTSPRLAACIHIGFVVFWGVSCSSSFC